MAAMSPGEKDYFEMSVFEHARHRIVWLLILMFSATITGTIITRYEDAFAAVPILVSFIPMLMDTGGNCGSQSATLIIRGIALDQIRFKDIFRVIFKEFRVSLIVSVVLALANGLRILIMYKGRSSGPCDRSVADRHGHHLQADRMHPAAPGKESPPGPGDHGLAPDHDAC